MAREAYASPNIHSNFVYIRGAFSTHARGWLAKLMPPPNIHRGVYSGG